MEILVLVSVSIVVFWIVAMALIEVFRNIRISRKKAKLKGRVVKISKKWLRDHNIAGENFGKIYDFPSTKYNEKLTDVYVKKLISVDQWRKMEQTLIENKERAVKQLAARLDDYKQRGYNAQDVFYASQELERAKNALISVPSEGESYSIPLSAIRVMPRNYDYVTGQIMQQAKRKGGVKRKKSMGKNPKLFRIVMWACVTILVCSIVLDAAWHVNDISNFVVNTLILHNK